MRPHFLLWAAIFSLSVAAASAHAQPPGKPFPPAMKPGMPVEGKPFAQPSKLEFGWIDVHVHLLGGRERDFPGAVQEAAAIVDSAGMRAMVLMSPPNVTGSVALYDTPDFIGAIRRYPGRFAFLGGGGILNPMLQGAASGEVSEALRKRFEEAAEKIVAQGAAGFGELAAHHLSHLPEHPYESVAADHPLLLLLADIAARYGLVIDLHFDVVTEDIALPPNFSSPPNPPTLKANVAGFERLLAHNRKAKIVWAHAGSDFLGHWTPQLSRELLRRHSNLYMSLRLGGGAPQNMVLVPGTGINPEWLAVFQEFPNRFVIGGDQFIASRFAQGTGPGMQFSARAPMIRQRTQKFLSLLPPELARKFAYENAERLYRLR